MDQTVSFLDDHIRQYPWVRAALTVELLKLQQFEQAQEAALPLIGTPYQAWFLYSRAWLEWSHGRLDSAWKLLDQALAIRGDEEEAPQTRPATAEFARFHGPFEKMLVRDRKWPESEWPRAERAIGKRISRADVPRLFWHLRPFLSLCASPFELVRGSLYVPPDLDDDACHWFVESLRTRPNLDEAADSLWVMGEGSKELDLPLMATCVFYLILAERHRDALRVCQRYLSERPRSSTGKSLLALSLHKCSYKLEATRVWEENLAQPSDGLTCLILGILAYQEGRPQLAARYFHEAVECGAGEVAWDFLSHL
jgi:tetratricopeptide (TPR) repeat protein